ncbi:MAG TPA: division/cell wall cluster transcriptional repressor MraZ [Candidatus Saccharimonadales bacterium]|nr:division/cell wall cluster transcriptional repressor MraZ [Candidatus Saccharimonadales bacterium]
MLIGQFDSKVSVKHQVAFPKKFREVLGDKLIITKGFETSLLVIAESQWATVLEDIEKSSVTRASARETKRFLLGGAAFVDLDDKGRFIVPDYLREFASLEEEIVFIGQDTYAEIWDKKHWNDYNQELAKNISEIAEKVTVRKEVIGNE